MSLSFTCNKHAYYSNNKVCSEVLVTLITIIIKANFLTNFASHVSPSTLAAVSNSLCQHFPRDVFVSPPVVHYFLQATLDALA